MARAIRDYNSVRLLLELISTYGFYNREDFHNLGILNQNTYDKALGSLTSALPRSALESRGSGKRKYFYIKRDYFSNRAPWLAASYFLHSAENDGVSLLLLNCLCGSPASLAQGELITRLELISSSEKDLRSLVPRRLSRLEKLGYIEKTGKLYRPAPDPLSGLNRGELTALYYLVSLYACSGFPRIPGEFLRRSMVREFFFRGEKPPKEAFLFRENCCRGVFDEELVCKLSQACRDRRLVSLTPWDGEEFQAAPLAVQLDPRINRWYLVYVNPEIRRAARVRLKNIKECTPLKEGFPEPTDAYEEIARETLSYTYLSTPGDVPPVLVEARLLLDENSYQIQQFRKEIFTGKIVRREEGIFYRALIRDPIELKPLLRSFYPYLQILSGAHNLDREIREELERMLERYGTVS